MRIDLNRSGEVAAPVSSERETARTVDAARQFEALLVAQMLKTVQEAGGGWLGSGEDSAATPALEYAQEQFAQALCASGGLGLATMVAEGLRARSAKPAPTETTAAD